MRIINLAYLLIFILAVFFSCKNYYRSSYAIRDFSSRFQPYLTRLVTKSVVGFDTAAEFIDSNMTDDELKHMGLSEHPVLRAFAYRAMLERPSLNHFNLLMNHLDDTAMVTLEGHEGSTYSSTVSDDIIMHSTWKNIKEKNKTVEEVIINHTYLHSAYTIVSRIDPQEKYYLSIKKMILCEKPFEDIERALYALAKYKKNEDVKIIHDLLLSHYYRMSSWSFALMQEFPNQGYLEVFDEYFKRGFYRSICGNWITSYANEFFNSLASYKNDHSTKILDKILNRRPFMPCNTDTSYLKQILFFAIWDNPCEQYLKMRKQIEGFMIEYTKFEELNKDALTHRREIIEPGEIGW